MQVNARATQTDKKKQRHAGAQAHRRTPTDVNAEQNDILTLTSEHGEPLTSTADCDDALTLTAEQNEDSLTANADHDDTLTMTGRGGTGGAMHRNIFSYVRRQHRTLHASRVMQSSAYDSKTNRI